MTRHENITLICLSCCLISRKHILLHTTDPKMPCHCDSTRQDLRTVGGELKEPARHPEMDSTFTQPLSSAAGSNDRILVYGADSQPMIQRPVTWSRGPEVVVVFVGRQRTSSKSDNLNHPSRKRHRNKNAGCSLSHIARRMQHHDATRSTAVSSHVSHQAVSRPSLCR